MFINYTSGEILLRIRLDVPTPQAQQTASLISKWRWTPGEIYAHELGHAKAILSVFPLIAFDTGAGTVSFIPGKSAQLYKQLETYIEQAGCQAQQAVHDELLPDLPMYPCSHSPQTSCP